MPDHLVVTIKKSNVETTYDSAEATLGIISSVASKKVLSAFVKRNRSRKEFITDSYCVAGDYDYETDMYFDLSNEKIASLVYTG